VKKEDGRPQLRGGNRPKGECSKLGGKKNIKRKEQKKGKQGTQKEGNEKKAEKTRVQKKNAGKKKPRMKDIHVITERKMDEGAIKCAEQSLKKAGKKTPAPFSSKKAKEKPRGTKKALRTQTKKKRPKNKTGERSKG